MIAIQHTQQEIDALNFELSVSSSRGTLTEQRYDEIMAVLLPLASIPDAWAGLILCGKPEWRKKHGVAAKDDAA